MTPATRTTDRTRRSLARSDRRRLSLRVCRNRRSKNKWRCRCLDSRPRRTVRSGRRSRASAVARRTPRRTARLRRACKTSLRCRKATLRSDISTPGPTPRPFGLNRPPDPKRLVDSPAHNHTLGPLPFRKCRRRTHRVRRRIRATVDDRRSSHRRCSLVCRKTLPAVRRSTVGSCPLCRSRTGQDHGTRLSRCRCQQRTSGQLSSARWSPRRRRLPVPLAARRRPAALGMRNSWQGR